MAKTVKGVARLIGPLSLEPWPPNAFRITGETSNTLQPNYKHCFMFHLDISDLSGRKGKTVFSMKHGPVLWFACMCPTVAELG